MGLLGWDQDTPGDKTQRGVVAVSYLLIFGMFLCSLVLAQSVPDDTDVSGLAVGLTSFLLSAQPQQSAPASAFCSGCRGRGTPNSPDRTPRQRTAPQTPHSAALTT